jgi:hypothetical protein
MEVRGTDASVGFAVPTFAEKFPLLIACIFSEIVIKYISEDQRRGFLWKL